MNMTKLGQRIDELEARREREYQAWLESLSDEQLRLALEGIRAGILRDRAMKRGEPISEPISVEAEAAAMAVLTKRPDFPPHLRREMTQQQLAEVERFVRG